MSTSTSASTAPAQSPRESAIAIHGVGAMGGAIVAGLVRAGRAADLLAVESHPQRSEQLRVDYPQVRVLSGPEAPSQAVAAAATHLIVVKPVGVLDAVAALAEHLQPGDIVASLALGITTASLAKLLPEGVSVLRVMPNTPALVGAGMSAISAGPQVPAEHISRVAALLGAIGEVAEVPEEQQDAVTAVSGSGPAYFFAVIEAMIEAGIAQGLSPQIARQLAVQTAYGAGVLVHESGEDPGLLRERVTSPGGSTAAALAVMQERGLPTVIAEGMAACARRSAEVSDELCADSSEGAS